jgi:hypothetical protein
MYHSINLVDCVRRDAMFLIEYKPDGMGCPNGGVYGELESYNWNSNDFADKRFPQKGTVLRFYAEHEKLDADFFYFGAEFICSEKMAEVIISFRHGEVDVIEVLVFFKGEVCGVEPKRYYLLRSREIRSILDEQSSVYEFRKDLKSGLPETDFFHKNRKIYDSISKFVVKKLNLDLDFFICSEMLIGEYVFSLDLKLALEAKGLKGVKFISIEESVYDASLDF